MRIFTPLLFFTFFTGTVSAQTRLESNGGFVPCEWVDRTGHSGRTNCRILEQGTVHGETSRVISINNKNYAYKLDYDNYRAELIMVKSDSYDTIWKGRFQSRHNKKDPLIETITISDGINLTIRNF